MSSICSISLSKSSGFPEPTVHGWRRRSDSTAYTIQPHAAQHDINDHASRQRCTQTWYGGASLRIRHEDFGEHIGQLRGGAPSIGTIAAQRGGVALNIASAPRKTVFCPFQEFVDHWIPSIALPDAPMISHVKRVISNNLMATAAAAQFTPPVCAAHTARLTAHHRVKNHSATPYVSHKTIVSFVFKYLGSDVYSRAYRHQLVNAWHWSYNKIASTRHTYRE
jgi:hypothetical protein